MIERAGTLLEGPGKEVYSLKVTTKGLFSLHKSLSSFGTPAPVQFP